MPSNISTGDYVYIWSTRFVGQVESTTTDGLHMVKVSGETKMYSSADLLRLQEADLHVLNTALALTANAIDRVYDEELYRPVYDEEGMCVYSEAAAAAIRAIEFIPLIVRLRELNRPGESF